MLKTKTILKSKHFTQKETQLLSGFTRDQLRTLYLSNLIVPFKKSTILYTWNQIIFLRLLFELREDWSFYQLKTAINNSKVDIAQAIEQVQDFLFLMLVYETEEEIHFLFKSTYGILYSTQIFESEGQSLIENTVPLLEGNIPSSKNFTFKSTTINIALVINDLKNIAKELNIEDFDLKIKQNYEV